MNYNSSIGFKIKNNKRSNLLIDKEQGNKQIKEKKEKKVKINLDIQNKNESNLNQSFSKPKLRAKSTFNKNENLLENQETINKSNRTIFNLDNSEYPKSSLSINKCFNNKSFMSENKSSYNPLFSEINIDKKQDKNQSFHNKGNLNQKKINFLNLINPNHNNNFYKKNKCDNIFNKDLVEALEGDSLNLIQQNLQNKIYDMGKEKEFQEFGEDIFDKPNIFNLRNQRKNKIIKITKKEFEKIDIDSRAEKNKTVIHNKLISNLSNSSSEDLLFAEKNIKFQSNFKKSSKKLLNNNNLNINDKLNFKKNNFKKNKASNDICNKDYTINVINNLKDKRCSSFNHLLKSTHSFKKENRDRSKTVIHSNYDALIKKNNISPINNSFISQEEIKKRKNLNKYSEKNRIFTLKKLVYDSFDDEEMIEDAVFDNFYFYPEDKIIYVIDCLVLILTFWSMIYMPLKLVLNNCDIKNSINSLNFENISCIFIDLLFIFDLIINFFKSFYNFDEQLETKSEKIIIHYLKGYFLIDFISSIPYYSIIRSLIFFTHKNMIIPVKCTKYYNHVINDKYQMLQLLKLLKFIKCFSKDNIVSKYISQELNEFTFFEDWSFLLGNILVLLLVFHITACIHIFVSSTTFPNWIIQKELQTSPFIKVYLGSIYFLITTVTSVGYGDITGNSFPEIIFQIFLLMVGIIAYSWLISSLSNYVQENNKKNEVFNQKLSLLKEIKLEHPKMPKELYDKIYLHLEYIHLGFKKDKSSLINFLPDTIQKSLLYEMYKPIIENFNFFKDFKNSEFVNQVISKLKPVLAVKNDLLLEQDEIIEETIFVKQGRLSLEVKIDTEHPEKSIQKLLNEEYFFGLENNEEYQKSAFGGVISVPGNNMNQSFINKKNLYNLYSGNDNNYIRVKPIKTNTKGVNKHKKVQSINTNYIHLRILDIRKNEHFGALLMFLNKRSPLILRVKTKKAELFFLKKIDAIEISTSYPNIWKRVNKKSFHNLKQIKNIMKKIIKKFCEAYGIDFDFGTKIYNNLNRININELNSKIIPDLNSNRMLGNKITILHKRLMEERRGSADVYNVQLKTLQNFPKQRQIIIFTKTNKEKDIEELVPENFEINNKLSNNKLKNNSKEFSKSPINESLKIKDNPIDYGLSINKVGKKETISGYENQIYKNENNFDYTQNNLNLSVMNNSNSNLNKTKKSILKNKQNKLNKKDITNKIQYGDEEQSNLMKSFGTPYHPEDINDELYQGEQMFDSISIRNNSKKELSQIKSQFLSYSNEKTNFSLFQQNLLNNENKPNNFTINNNYFTQSFINNFNNNKFSIDSSSLSIHKFDFNIIHKISKNKSHILAKSFQISKQEKFNIKSISTNNIKVINKDTKNLNNKKKILNFNSNSHLIIKNNNNLPKINYTKTIIKNTNKISESYSSDCSSINYEPDSNNNNNNNNNEIIFECENQINNIDTLKSVKISKPLLQNKKNNNNNENNNKILKINQNVKINIKPSYINLNEITEGKFAKSKGLQNCIKNIVIKKILKHEKRPPEKHKSLGVNRKSIQTLTRLKTTNIPKNQIQRRKSLSLINKVPQNLRNRKSYYFTKKESQSPKKRNSEISSILCKNKLTTKNISKKFSNKLSLNNDKIKKSDVKSKFNMISDINNKSLGINIVEKDNTITESNNSSNSSYKQRKNNDEFLLDYVNRNIKDDKAVLNNPDKFYNGLLGSIMKKVNKAKTRKIEEE